MATRQRKKQKVEDGSESTAPGLQHLVKSKICLEEGPSPGAVHSCRVAVQGRQDDLTDVVVYCATGAKVFRVRPALSQLPNPEQGKEGVFMPSIVQGSEAVLVPHITHAAEVQHLELVETADSVLLGSIDAYGSALVSRFDTQRGSPSNPTPSRSYILAPPSGDFREAGWAGITFSSEQPSVAATARQFARSVTLHDGEVAVRSISTFGYPTAVKIIPLQGFPMLAVGEGHQVSIWDARAAGSTGGGCVQRVNAAVPGFVVNSLSWCDLPGAGLLGAAGSDRSVSLIEPRKWRLITKWAGCSKGSIWHLSFSSLDPHYCFVSGLDQEVVAGRWDAAPARTMFQDHSNVAADASTTAQAGGRAVGPKVDERGNFANKGGSISFRGDSRWLGVSKAPAADILVGYGASQNLFIAKFGKQVKSQEPAA